MLVRAPAPREPWTAPAAPGLGLHLDHLYLGAEDVLQAVGGPLVDQVGHGLDGVIG